MRGFTIIELMIVVAIIGILAIASYQTINKQRQISEAILTMMENFASAQKEVYLRTSSFATCPLTASHPCQGVQYAMICTSPPSGLQGYLNSASFIVPVYICRVGQGWMELAAQDGNTVFRKTFRIPYGRKYSVIIDGTGYTDGT